MKKEYSWKAYQFKADAQLVGKELEQLEILGEITPKEVVEFARNNPKSELYKCFDWDDAEAGEKWRLSQASSVICSISIKIKEEPEVKQKVYFNVRSSESGTKKFKNIKDVLENDDEYKQLVNKATNELNNCKEKYETLIKKEDLKEIIFDIYRNI